MPRDSYRLRGQTFANELLQEVILWELSDYLRGLAKFVSTILNSIDTK